MRTLPRPDIRIALLGALCLLLGWWVVVALAGLSREPVFPEVKTASAPTLPRPLQSGELHFPSITDFSEVTARPLFFADRRLPAADDATQAAPAVGTPERYFSVRGVILASSEMVAILEDRRTGSSKQVAAGGTVDGWVVRSIDPGGVTLGRGEAQTSLLPLHDSERGQGAEVRVLRKGTSD